MDKETLSNYGWIVICILVIVVMIALATPFGKYIAGGVKAATTSLFGLTNDKLGGKLTNADAFGDTASGLPKVDG